MVAAPYAIVAASAVLLLWAAMANLKSSPRRISIAVAIGRITFLFLCAISAISFSMALIAIIGIGKPSAPDMAVMPAVNAAAYFAAGVLLRYLIARE